MQPRCLSASVAMADSDYAINHVIYSLCLDVYGLNIWALLFCVLNCWVLLKAINLT